ncbi:hypothetical protein [Sporichthya polymorpha]|uniref:hypothetical protein n=1 Tax=Sporichthya polymorpha TaxID=35751 RepID=UPI00035CB5B3|nr:hypothetical protein [Sporichthya polymorpha]
MIRRTVSGVAVGGLLALAGGAALMTSARAAEPGVFTLSARADSVGIQTIAQDAPVVSIGGGEIALVTPSSAQSQIDSFGGSRSFASAPYPGDLIVSLPPTIAGVSGGSAPVPEYPAYVSSDYPVRNEQVLQFGPQQLTARSAENSSEAQAQIGLQSTPPEVAAAITKTSVVRNTATGGATAFADALLSPLSYTDVLKLGQVHTTAKAVWEPGATKPTLTSTFDAGNVTIAGQTFGLTSNGLVVPGSKTPVDDAAIAELLKNTGAFLEVLPEQRTATSVTSASLRLTYQQVLPNAGLTTVRLILGQVSATAVSEASGLAGPAAVPGGAASGGEVPGVLDPVGIPGAGVDAAGVGQLPSVPVTTNLVPGAAGTDGVQLAGRTAPPLPDFDRFYLVLVLGALAAVVTARIRSARRFV